MVIGLNPSTADEVNDDPTVRRCINYAKDWGFAELCMTNLFAFRSTDPKRMKSEDDPIGPDNDRNLVQLARDAGVVVAAWGTHGAHLGRGLAVAKMIGNLSYLKLTQTGYPAHPLYLPSSLKPQNWER